MRDDKGIADWETNESLPPRINRKYTNNKGNQSTINPFGRGFVMATLNINSLLGHFDDLKFFVLNSKIDVLAINETKIDSSVNDNEIHLPGFEVVRKDRSVNGRSGGGVCKYLRNNINYQISDDICVGQLECVVIEIIRPHSRPFFVCTWYKPPNSAQDVFRQFESLVDKMDSEQKDFYLLGDLICNMLDGSNNHNFDQHT